jgi:hypothetical protein
MIVQCEKCQKYFDDQFRWTICPHETFSANDGQNNFAHHPESFLGDGSPPMLREIWKRKQGQTRYFFWRRVAATFAWWLG